MRADIWSTVNVPTPGSLEGSPSQGTPTSAMILFHGYGASAEDLAPLGAEISPERKVYCPEGPIAVPIGWAMEGRAWFPIDMEALMAAQEQGGFRDFSRALPTGVLEVREKLLPWLYSLSERFSGRVSATGDIALLWFCNRSLDRVPSLRAA